MFDRLQKPYLTVETGEAYQPIRLTYDIGPKGLDLFIQTLEKLQCIQKNTIPHTWTWHWQGECDDIHFESVNSFRKNPEHPTRLGTLSLRENKLYINLPSFKRACLAVPFFHKVLDPSFAKIHYADFINKVFALDERLPHGFTELFKDEELNHFIEQRVSDYYKVKEECEHAPTAEDALVILSEYTKAEAQKRLPYVERYLFEFNENDSNDAEVMFLAFYIFMRGREIVAIKRWYGQAGYSLNEAADEILEEVFGGMGIDIID